MTLYRGTLSYMEGMVSGDGKTTSPVNLFKSAHDSASCFLQAFSVSSLSMQVETVITVCYRVKVMK
jgi:hypothetical protein